MRGVDLSNWQVEFAIEELISNSHGNLAPDKRSENF